MLSKAYSPSLVQGILQIHYNGSWGTICDDNWDMTDTRIACKQLGYKNASTFKHLGQGPDPIWLDDVDCNGGESSLDQCTHIGWGVHNCGHHEDVGIVCNTGKAQPLRLASKEYSSLSVKGILQIYHNGQWGTICDDYWDMTDTNIACKQLGYTSASTYKHLGQGTDPIWLDDVDCNGGESSLDQCTHIGWGVHNCGHSEDVGIECTGAAPLRLLSKTTSSSSVQGILQIFYNGQWGTICDDHWDMTDTNIACKQLGYDSALSFTHLGQGTGPIWLDDVVCNGGESTLDQCTHGGWAVHNCGHGEDVGIVCNSGKELRLLGKTFTRTTVQGILQIFHNNKWGTICDDGWDMTDTNIACKQLGYERAVTFKHVGQGTNTIWLDEVDCNGVESTVDQCHHRGWGKHDCDHSEDVGIVCNSVYAVCGKFENEASVIGKKIVAMKCWTFFTIVMQGRRWQGFCLSAHQFTQNSATDAVR
ncbi:Deleted in malignant brain tumors 1 protein [Exaiptasia diaphana]|nr:Deleted in malignant brain tumors 1 protein [Exaiptasia diaphana]